MWANIVAIVFKIGGDPDLIFLMDAKNVWYRGSPHEALSNPVRMYLVRPYLPLGLSSLNVIEENVLFIHPLCEAFNNA